MARAIQSKSVPLKTDWIILLEDVKSLVDTGLISFPGVDQKVIDDGIAALESVVSGL